MRRPSPRQPSDDERVDLPAPGERSRLPMPSPQFRRRAWIAFQRALDPLAPPRPLRLPRR